jgi:hypothetical protein
MIQQHRSMSLLLIFYFPREIELVNVIGICTEKVEGKMLFYTISMCAFPLAHHLKAYQTHRCHSKIFSSQLQCRGLSVRLGRLFLHQTNIKFCVLKDYLKKYDSTEG